MYIRPQVPGPALVYCFIETKYSAILARPCCDEERKPGKVFSGLASRAAAAGAKEVLRADWIVALVSLRAAGLLAMGW